MSAEEFGLWLAEYQREPWGDVRADLHCGIVGAAVANMAGKTLKEGKSLAPADLMPRWGDDTRVTDDPDDFLRSL